MALMQAENEHGAWLAALQPGDEAYVDRVISFGGIVVRRVARITKTQIILESHNEMAPPQRFNRFTGFEVGTNKALLRPVTEAVRATIAAQILCRRAHEAGKWLARLTEGHVEAMSLEDQQSLMRVIGGVRVLSKEGGGA
jgi:hypothetical protein